MSKPRVISIEKNSSKREKDSISIEFTRAKSNNISIIKSSDKPNLISPSKKAENSIISSNQITPTHTPSDFFNDFSILKVIDNKIPEFNYTDINSLGFNINDESPLIPRVLSLVSDAPIVGSSYPMPPSYSAIPIFDPKEKISLFPDETLFYIVFVQTGEIFDMAKSELLNRGYTYDGTWHNSSGSVWSVDQWEFIN